MIPTRCCVCGLHARGGQPINLEPTDLPGGWRCTDHDACRERVREIVAAHQGLAEVCDG